MLYVLLILALFILFWLNARSKDRKFEEMEDKIYAQIFENGDDE